MMLSSSVPQFALWRDRAIRFQGRFSQRTLIAKKDVRWYFGGGKRFFERYSPEILSAHKWCFVVGCNNSGTSLLQSIFERSGQVSTMPHEGQRYTRVLMRAARRGHERVWTEFLDELRMSDLDGDLQVPRLLHDWMEEYSMPLREILVEKTTANAVRMLWLQKVFPRSHFIGLIRNGYAVTEGIRRKGHKPIRRGARHWNRVNKIMMEDARSIEHFLLVRYEDLVSRTDAVARELEKFLGIVPGGLNVVPNQTFSFDTVLGSSEQPIRDLNSESLKRLTPQDMEAIREEASEMLRFFGHDGALLT